MSRGYFITGTDTGCGKTLVTLGLMQALQNDGFNVLGMKPIASGCERSEVGLRNEDALMIQRQGTLQLGYEAVNPYAFEPPIAPHLAAEAEGLSIDIGTICAGFQKLATQADLVLVEGVGGWQVPLSGRVLLDSLVVALDLPVILVVGLKLGCINHALLTRDAIIASGCRFEGWVANRLDPEMLVSDANLQTLSDHLGVPPLGVVPFMPQLDIDCLADSLQIGRLSCGGSS